MKTHARGEGPTRSQRGHKDSGALGMKVAKETPAKKAKGKGHQRQDSHSVEGERTRRGEKKGGWVSREKENDSDEALRAGN